MLKKGLIANNQMLYLIPQTVPYKNSHEPLLSEQKKQTIEEKLKLQKQALVHTKQRQTEGEYYFRYNYNPFLQVKGPDTKSILRRTKQPIHNIVDKINQLQEEYPPVKASTQQVSLNLNLLKVLNSNFSDKLLNNIQKAKQLASRIKSPFDIKQKVTQVEQPQTFIPSYQRNQQYFSQLEIQDIAAVKEQNFFVHNKKINIFKIAKGDDDQICGKQMLGRNHFCGNSVVQKIAKIKIPVYRDISTLGREVISGQQTKQNVIDYIDSYELSYKVNQLIFQDIMSLASNRLSADFLNRIINFQQVTNKDDMDTSSLEDQQQIKLYYRHNQQNAQINFVNKNQQVQQINDYKALTSNYQQMKHERKYVKIKNNVEQQLQLKKDLRSNTVKDKQLHNQLSKGVQLSLKSLVGLDLVRQQADRLVRANKISKNRNEGLKLKTLLQTLAYKNKYQQQFQPKQKKQKQKQKPKK